MIIQARLEFVRTRVATDGKRRFQCATVEEPCPKRALLSRRLFDVTARRGRKRAPFAGLGDAGVLVLLITHGLQKHVLG